MSSRFLIPILCLGAVAFACGPRTHNEASTPKNTKNSGSVVAVSKSAPVLVQKGAPRREAKSSKPSLAAELYVSTDEANIRFALLVKNTGKKRVELNFPGGQTYDFVVIDSTGREMWRWASGRMFTQTLRNKLLGAGESLSLEETMKASPLPPGRYVARAILTSANFPLVQEAEFTVEPTTIASR